RTGASRYPEQHTRSANDAFVVPAQAGTQSSALVVRTTHSSYRRNRHPEQRTRSTNDAFVVPAKAGTQSSALVVRTTHSSYRRKPVPSGLYNGLQSNSALRSMNQ